MTKNEERGAAAVTDILKYNQAIRQAEMSHPKKVICFVLSSLADPKTGIIPDRFQPGYGTLKRFTGLGRSTVIRLVAELESAGWFKKSSPTVQQAWRDKDTNNYLLTIPASALANLGEDPGPEEDQSRSEMRKRRDPRRDWSQSGTGLVPQRDAK